MPKGNDKGLTRVFTNRAVGAALALVAFTTGVARAQIDMPTTRVTTCTTAGCHTPIIDREVMHAPVASLQCLECHTFSDTRRHQFELTKPPAALCLDCHEPNHADRVIHQPVADGDCLSCHDPHGSEHTMVLRKDPAKGLCLDCHQQDYTEFEFVHGPVAVGACLVCHDAHSSSYPNLLTQSPAALCSECHEDQAPKGTALWRQHKPMEDGCTACHDPHASDSKFQLVQASTSLCVSCHTGVEESINSAHMIHGPLSTEGGCVECHDPHFSSFSKLQRAAQPELCLNCHDQPLITTDGRTLTDMKALLEDNPYHHGPIREGACTLCHQAHSSEEPALLSQAYPQAFYAPYRSEDYKLCFTCHQSELVSAESGQGLTGFRNGVQNLHRLHVNQEKGRTCRACHEVHASKKPFHIRESVPFGAKGWLLDINFQQLPEGGTCAPACHKPKTYDRTFTPEKTSD